MIRSDFSIVILVFFLLVSSEGYSQHRNPELSGEWINDLGSILVIDSITPDHQITGAYRSSSGVDGKVFPLSGWINKTTPESDVYAISFTVRWEGYGSITAWTGYFDKDENGRFIKTLWHLIRPSEENSWERIISNSSTFRPY